MPVFVVDMARLWRPRLLLLGALVVTGFVLWPPPLPLLAALHPPPLLIPGLDREVPSLRNESLCQSMPPAPGSLHVAVVMVTVPGEQAEPVLRAVHNVLRLGGKRVSEVILVQDHATADDAITSNASVLAYLRALDPRLRVILLDDPQGELVARIHGARHTTAPGTT